MRLSHLFSGVANQWAWGMVGMSICIMSWAATVEPNATMM